jgi:putative restriction endonuclease
VDHLFDRGFISFDHGGQLLISPVAHRESFFRMGISVYSPLNVGRFTEAQRRYLNYHPDEVFLESKIYR